MEISRIVAKKQTDQFVSLTEEELNLFVSIQQRIELKKGEKLIELGEISRGFYLVETGLLREFYYKNGRDVTEHFASEGQGMMCTRSLFLKQPSELIIEALEKSVVYLTPYQDLIQLTEKYKVFSIYLRKLFEFVLIMSQEKADSWRFETARERYNRFLKDFPEAAKRASVNHIASYLLMTPESLSRVRSGTL